MDIYDYLKMDHRKVSDLFKQFKKTESFERKKEIIDFLARELLIHAKSEEETFYKVLEKFSESRADALHGEKEHKDIEDQLNIVMSHAKETKAELVNKVEKLQEIVDHHVEEEESEIFDKAKEVLSQAEACAIKEKMHHRKMKYYLKEYAALTSS